MPKQRYCKDCQHIKTKGAKHLCIHPVRNGKEYQVDPNARAIGPCFKAMEPKPVKEVLKKEVVKVEKKKKEEKPKKKE